MARIVIVGGSFAGLTVALGLAETLPKSQHEILVLARGKEFIFLPSLIWVPFGLREKRDISFPIAPLLESRGVRFVHGAVRTIDLGARKVVTWQSEYAYDHLVLATGVKQDFLAVPGLGPSDAFTQSIFSWEDADRARFAFDDFLDEPGPVVIGLAPGANGYAPTYEFALNMAHQLAARGLSARAPITFVTHEPRVGSGILGGDPRVAMRVKEMLARASITSRPATRIHAVDEHRLHFDDGTTVDFAYAVVTPAFLGVDPVRALTAITDARGFVEVAADLRVRGVDHVYAAGACVSAPRAITGMVSEGMGQVVAKNLAADLLGGAHVEADLDHVDYAFDAGGEGAILTTHDEGLHPVAFLPGLAAHWAKVAFERWFMATMKRGRR